MSLQDRFIQFIEKESLFQQNDTLLVGVSGGVDSVVLCELCYRAGYRFLIAHCNFKLRHQESERDKNFVSELAGKYGVELLLREFDTTEYASKNKLSIQEAARKLRYDWFNEILYLPNTTSSPVASWILTAHHADDNIETMLMNFFRGTGIQGLRGILPKQGKIVRPMLSFRKEEIRDFANRHHLNWVEDSSNISDKYTRNYFRNQLIPLIRNIYPEVEHNLLNNLRRFADIEILYRDSINGYKEKLLEKKGTEIHIPVLKLKKYKAFVTIVHEIISDFGFTAAQVNEVVKLLESETGRYVQSGTHRIIKNRNWLIVTLNTTQEAQHVLIQETDSIIAFESGELHIESIKSIDPAIPFDKTPTANLTARLDAAEIHFPLLLRKWKTGDYFYPLGMKKKKKLSRFLIDQKLSKSQKENCWVIEMNKKILWVVGQRIDDRFKITGSCRQILSITLKR